MWRGQGPFPASPGPQRPRPEEEGGRGAKSRPSQVHAVGTPWRPCPSRGPAFLKPCEEAACSPRGGAPCGLQARQPGSWGSFLRSWCRRFGKAAPVVRSWHRSPRARPRNLASAERPAGVRRRRPAGLGPHRGSLTRVPGSLGGARSCLRSAHPAKTPVWFARVVPARQTPERALPSGFLEIRPLYSSRVVLAGPAELAQGLSWSQAGLPTPSHVRRACLCFE